MLPNKPDARLHVQMQEYQSRYFSDLTFRDLHFKRKHFAVKYEDGSIEEFDPQEQGELDITLWKINAIKLMGRDGQCLPEEKRIVVSENLKGKWLKSCLLHEMIHAYESELWPSHRDWLFLQLYRKVSKSLGRRTADKFLERNLWAGDRQPMHSGLFLLKALELDLQLKWPLGFTFGYGRPEIFKRALGLID